MNVPDCCSLSQAVPPQQVGVKVGVGTLDYPEKSTLTHCERLLFGSIAGVIVKPTLSATEVAAIKEDGMWRVDRNLYLQVCDNGGTRSWLFRYRYGGRLRRMGFGPARLVSLSEAKRRSINAQKLLLDGIDPLAERKAQRGAHSMTFQQCADAFLKAHHDSWGNAKHQYQWRRTLELYAYPVIGKLPVGQVSANHVVKILEPIWASKSETAGRVRGRIEKVLDWARVAGYRSGDNPAKWQGELEHRLPSLKRVQTIKHHPTIAYAEAPAVYQALTQRTTTSARALQFVMLTAARVGEALGATWDELDLDAATPVWTVPAERMKMRQPHRVPLSPEAVALLRALPGKRVGLVFPGSKRGRKLSDMTLRKLFRTITGKPVTTHGLRSTFRDWSAEQTDYARDVAEAALAHSLGTKVETAYLRTDLLDQRVGLMTDWADFLTGATTADPC